MKLEFRRWLNEERINPSFLRMMSGGADVVNCMKTNGAASTNIYQILQQIQKGQKFSDTIFLGLDQKNLLLQAITELAGGIPWHKADSAGVQTVADDTSNFLDEAMQKGLKLMFFLPKDVNFKKGYTHKEFIWISQNCQDQAKMSRTTIVVGLYSIVDDSEMQAGIHNGAMDVNHLKQLLMNWQGNLSQKASSPDFISKQPKDFNQPQKKTGWRSWFGK